MTVAIWSYAYMQANEVSQRAWTMIVFFKQKTAYEMRISDWSADVCSSDPGQVRIMPRTAASFMSLPWAASLSGRDSSGKDAGALRIGGFHAMLPYRFAIIRAGVAPRGPEGTSRGRSGNRSQRPVPGGGRERGTIRSEEHTPELQSLMRIRYATFC